MRFDRDEATRVDAEDMIFALKKMEPSFPSGTENLRWKNAVTQDLVSCSGFCKYMRQLKHLRRDEARSSRVHSKKKTQLHDYTSALSAYMGQQPLLFLFIAISQ